MELESAIKFALDGKSVIFIGAGASYGAMNLFDNDFPSGYKLAEHLYKSCGEKVRDDLEDASQLFFEKHGSIELIKEIKKLLNVKSVELHHEIIYQLPWIRYYTTNYDNVHILACQKQGKNITPVVLSNKFRKYRECENICIYINGHIDRLSEETLHNEFKLIADSYLSYQNINNSQWGGLFVEDLKLAKSIICIGYSMNHDLDIARIVNDLKIKDKVIFIDKPGLDDYSKRTLNRYGEVYDTGIEEFAKKIQEVKLRYTPKTFSKEEYIYSCFSHEYKKQYPLVKSTEGEIFSFYLYGNYCDDLTYEQYNKYLNVITRTSLNAVINSIKENKKVIFIHSFLGNGKTTLINLICHKLSREDVHIFTFKETFEAVISEEISVICSLNGKKVVIIENYFNFLHIIRKFSLHNLENIIFIFTSRTTIVETKMLDVFDILKVESKESEIFDINVLDDSELDDCLKIFSESVLFGKHNNTADFYKQFLLINPKNGNKRISSILIHIFDSSDMKARINKIVNAIKDVSDDFYDILILLLVAKVMELQLSASDIKHLFSIDVARDPYFLNNEAVNELLSISANGIDYKVKSAVTALTVLREVDNASALINVLSLLAIKVDSYSFSEKYESILKNIVSYSHLNHFLKHFKNKKDFLLMFYENVKDVQFYRNNDFFWLQYAIACIEVSEFERAQNYINVARSIAEKRVRFIPFQINNQEARLLLEKICKNKSAEIIIDFNEAHKLLMLPIESRLDDESVVIRIFEYYCKPELKSQFIQKVEAERYRQCCVEACRRLQRYLSGNVGYEQQKYVELKNKLMNCSLES